MSIFFLNSIGADFFCHAKIIIIIIMQLFLVYYAFCLFVVVI